MNTLPRAALIDGKAYAAGLVKRLASRTGAIKEATGLVPGLAVILVGDDPASQVYVSAKERRTVEAGMASYVHRIPAHTSEAEILDLLADLNGDPSIHGILVQLPLPKHLDAGAVIQAIAPAKDVDGFHALNAGRLVTGQRALVPCTPLGCLMLLKDRLGDLAGLNALVIGKSNIVGKPMAQLLMAEECTVTVAHVLTRYLPELCRQADIVVVAAGSPGLVRGDWIRPGATVIDVGITRVELDGHSRIMGDVAFEEAGHAAAITPVPGGVGPMTIACLLSNTLTAFTRQNGLPDL